MLKQKPPDGLLGGQGLVAELPDPEQGRQAGRGFCKVSLPVVEHLLWQTGPFFLGTR